MHEDVVCTTVAGPPPRSLLIRGRFSTMDARRRGLHHRRRADPMVRSTYEHQARDRPALRRRSVGAIRRDLCTSSDRMRDVHERGPTPSQGRDVGHIASGCVPAPGMFFELGAIHHGGLRLGRPRNGGVSSRCRSPAGIGAGAGAGRSDRTYEHPQPQAYGYPSNRLSSSDRRDLGPLYPRDYRVPNARGSRRGCSSRDGGAGLGSGIA